MRKIFVLMLFLLVNIVQAATITVTSTADSGVGSLRQAISDANSGDTITFDASLDGQTITLTTKRIDIGKNLTINGDLDGDDLPDVTISSNNAFRIFVIDEDTLNLNGLVITKGSSYDGGAIFNRPPGTLNVTNSTLSNNTAENNGGAIYNEGTLNVTNSILSDNTAGYEGGVIANSGTSNVINSTFSNNSANVYGGVISNKNTLTLTNSILSNNSSTNGGAISIFSDNPSIVNNSLLSGNTANLGGAIYNFDESKSGTLGVNNSLLSGNTANFGGAIYNRGRPLTLTNSTLSGNSANGAGGAIRNFNGNINVRNSLIWNNRRDGVTGNANSAIESNNSVTRSYSLIQGFDGSGTGNLDGLANAADANYPLFNTAFDFTAADKTNGDFTLQSGSPAIDVGNNADAPSGNDLAGNNRIQGGTVDLGAYELIQAILGDINNDSQLNQADLTALITVYGLTSSSESWNPAADLNDDGRINALDYRLLRIELAK